MARVFIIEKLSSMHRYAKSKDTKAKLAPKEKISYERKADPAITEYSVKSLNWLRKAEFLMSAPKLSLCVEDTGYEIAFAGRSNAGKSSAINTLTNQNSSHVPLKDLDARR